MQNKKQRYNVGFFTEFTKRFPNLARDLIEPLSNLIDINKVGKDFQFAAGVELLGTMIQHAPLKEVFFPIFKKKAIQGV